MDVTEQDVLTDSEARSLGLPSHLGKDEIEWGRERTSAVNLECSICHNKVTRTLSLPPDVAPGQNLPFVCAECTSPSGKRKRTIGIKPAKHRGRPKKVPETGQESERMDESQPRFEGALVAALAGSDSLEFLVR
jgi:hypothetical protein